MDGFVNHLWDLAIPVLSTVVTFAIGWAATRFSAWSGVQIEAKHREALHSAIMTGIGYARSRLTLGGSAASPKELVIQAKSYVETSVPDAIKALGVTDTKLADMIAAKAETVEPAKAP